MRLAEVPLEAAAYHAVANGGASGAGPVNQTESGGASKTGQMSLDAEADMCKVCEEEEADEKCQGGLCTGCCESNRGTGPFQCCDGHWVYVWDSDETAEDYTVRHGGTRGTQRRDVAAMLKANEMVERKQRGDGNCMFRSLSVATGKGPEYHEELRRRVVGRMRAGAKEEGVSKLSKLGAWGTREAMKVAAEEMQVRVNVITMDGPPGMPVEIQRVGEHGPVTSVALYAQHTNALVKKQVKLRCSGRDVIAVRNNGMLVVTGWRASKQQKPRIGRRKAEWKQELRQTGNAVSVLD